MTILGVLALCNGGQEVGENSEYGPGIWDPSRYPGTPVLRKTIPGAWASNVVPGDPSCEQGYVEAAQELERKGADAITSNCGFTIRYQDAIAAAVSVPVSMSSLLLLPTLLLNVPTNKKVAVLTYNARFLDDDIITSLGIADRSRLIVEGLEGTSTYDWMLAEDGKIAVEEVLADIDSLIARVQAHENVGAILCECTVFPAVSRKIRRATGLPVYDASNNIELLLAGVS